MAIREDDLAAIVLALEERMSREDIAAALGVDERGVAEIASGYLPDDDVADRLRQLASDPARQQGSTVRSAVRISGIAIAAFVLVDLAFFVAVAVFVFLR